MQSQIDEIKKEYADIQTQLNAPELSSDPKKMAELGKRQAELSEVISAIDNLEKTEKEMQDNAEIINSGEDAEMAQMAMEENAKLIGKKEKL